MDRDVPGPAPAVATAPTSIVLDGVSVSYEVYADAEMSVRQMFAQRFSARRRTKVDALVDVSLVTRRGDSVGVIGSNGSGKSTLLATVAGLLPATSGSVLVSSQPSLLGVNAALKPALSGRRNILVGGLAMGLDISEIHAATDAILDFTELGDALDRPLRTYSSGMRQRLAFALATIKTPEILLIDEALAVGDRSFRERSLARLRELQAAAGTIMMVTHNLAEIRSTCNRAIWIDQGRVRRDGPVGEVLDEYERDT